MIASLAEPGSSLVILRREHKELLDRLAPEVPTRVRCCAAQLINYFEHWRQWKREHYPTEWIYQPLVKIRYDLMNAFSIHVIRSSINMLQELGFLSVRKNDRDQNRRNGQDKTHQYLIHSDRIKAALKNPSSQSVAETEEESLFVEVKTSCVNVETSCVNVETSRVTDEIHTQIPSLIPATDSCSLFQEREEIDSVAEVEDPWQLPANEVNQELIDSCEKAVEVPLPEQDCNEDQSSAAPALKCDEVLQANVTPLPKLKCDEVLQLNVTPLPKLKSDEVLQPNVTPLPKLKSDRPSGFTSNEERDAFYYVLVELGKSKGAKSPVGWSAAIIKSIDAGEPCQYLIEFRAGQPLGIGEKQEWESAPGQPFQRFIGYLRRKLQYKDMTDEQAIAAAHRQLKDVNLARSLWESFKRSIAKYGDDWEKQKPLGVANAYLPPELLPDREVSVEQLVATMTSLEAGCVQLQGLAESGENSISLSPKLEHSPVDPDPMTSVGQVCLGLSSSVIEPKQWSMAELQEKLNRPVSASLARMLASEMGYRVEEGLVLPESEIPSVEHLRSLLNNSITASKVERLVAAHPEWGFWIDESGELHDF